MKILFFLIPILLLFSCGNNSTSLSGKSQTTRTEVDNNVLVELPDNSISSEIKSDAEKIKKKAGHITTGDFIDIVSGDYQHLQMKTGNDTTYFWLSESFDYSLLKKGNKIKAFWRLERNYIPEAGDTVTMKVVYDVKLIE